RSPMSPDERAIRDLVDIWMKASRAGDTATVLSLMSDDVVFMVPGREPFGKQTFAANSRSMDGVRLEGLADIRELKVLGDWAYVRNYIEIAITPPGGETVRRSGYTLTILRKEPDGKWLLARDANLLSLASPPRLRSMKLGSLLHRGALLSSRLAQRRVDAVLPAGTFFLKEVEHVLVDAQRHCVFHVRKRRCLGRQLCRLGRRGLEGLLGRRAGIWRRRSSSH